MKEKISICRFCNYSINIAYPKTIHAGFSNMGFMYCSKCPNLLTWGSYNREYMNIIQGKHPWDLNENEKNKVEDAIIKCECGGSFKFSAAPRCPNCNNEIPEILSDKIHYIVLKKEIDGDKENIWKNIVSV